MASQGGNLAVSYEDVMRTMESALRQQQGLSLAPRGPHHTLVMEAVKAPPNSSTTRVVEVDPENIRNSIPDSDRGPTTLRRTTSITMASRQSYPTMADSEPESERPESTILLVTIEELEAEAAGPITERIPQAGDRTSGVQLVQQHVSAPPPLMMMMTPAQAFAPAPAKKSSAGIVLAIVGVIALFAIVAGGAYAIRLRRVHAPHPVTAGIVATPPPAATTATPAEPPPAEAAPPPVVPEPSAKVDDGAASRVAVGPKKAASHKKTAKKSAIPVASGENGAAAASNDDPSTLLNKGIDPATDL